MKSSEKIKEEAGTMKTIIVNGRRHVAKVPSRDDKFFTGNYKGTGMVLCGILESDQTLEKFKNEWIENQLKIL